MTFKLEFSLKNVPLCERPRERLIKYGPEVLTNSELIAVIIGTGTRNEGVMNLSSKLLKEEEGIQFLSTSTIAELKSYKGIGSVKAAQIKAAVELGRRMRNYRSERKIRISSPSEAAELVMEDMRYLKKEMLKVIFLNTKNYVMDITDISIGSLSSSIVHPREIYTEAIRKCCASIIVSHNHPSGDPQPSSEDISVTKRIAEAGKIIGIELTDHIIIGDGIYTSMKEKGLF